MNSAVRGTHTHPPTHTTTPTPTSTAIATHTRRTLLLAEAINLSGESLGRLH